MNHPITPDGGYFIVRGRLWRCSNPALDLDVRQALTHQLMAARRDKGAAIRLGDGNGITRQAARARVDAAKTTPGEWIVPWWTDGAPDYKRRNTPYAEWYAVQEAALSDPAVKPP